MRNNGKIFVGLMIFLFLSLPNASFTQTKFEKEYRIDREDVPERARQFVDTLNFDKKIKWYREENADAVSIEAKSRYNKAKYSIEFDTLGNIEDVEIEKKVKDLPAQTWDTILQSLNKELKKYKLMKIQIQFSGDRQSLLPYLLKQESKGDIVTKYELVLKGVSGGERNWFEYTFSERGELEKKVIILLRNTDNLEY